MKNIGHMIIIDILICIFTNTSVNMGQESHFMIQISNICIGKTAIAITIRIRLLRRLSFEVLDICFNFMMLIFI